MEMFLGKLKEIKLIFNRDVSTINKNVATVPVSAQEVLDFLNRRYNMGIKKEDFAMETNIDTIGEHFVPVVYKNDVFKKDFKFFVKILIRPIKKAEVEKKVEKGADGKELGPDGLPIAERPLKGFKAKQNKQ